MFLTAESAGPQDRLGSERNGTQRIGLDWMVSVRIRTCESYELYIVGVCWEYWYKGFLAQVLKYFIHIGTF